MDRGGNEPEAWTVEGESPSIEGRETMYNVFKHALPRRRVPEQNSSPFFLAGSVSAEAKHTWRREFQSGGLHRCMRTWMALCSAILEVCCVTDSSMLQTETPTADESPADHGCLDFRRRRASLQIARQLTPTPTSTALRTSGSAGMYFVMD